MNMNLRIKTASPMKSLTIGVILTLMIVYVILIAYPLFNMVMSSLKPHGKFSNTRLRYRPTPIFLHINGFGLIWDLAPSLSTASS